MLLPVRRGAPDVILVFLPGFLSSAGSYRRLLEPLTDAGTAVVVPQLYRRGQAISGRFTVRDEAAAATDLMHSLVAAHPRAALAVGGHSRGGQAAWLAAAQSPDGARALVLVDPVDGEGRQPTVPVSTSSGAVVRCPTLIIGAEVSGRCAPAAVNHEVFAAATPGARHITVPMGHADMLDDRARRLGRLLCSGADDPDSARAACTSLIADFLATTLVGA